MQYKSGNQIREDFLRFFESKEHRRVHSSSLVPQNDPTLLFTNAGMNQFKDVFRGEEKREYVRAVSSQKCVRAGGKHNDLENVGFTRRHHTFFEMLGNFSFGDYFKREAIAYAWELLTSPQWFGIDPARLYVTIFEGDASVPRDDEAEQLWIETGVPKDRIFEMSAKDNFWQMGETGPCGPCSEIFYDLGIEASETGPGGEFVDKPFPHDDQRYVEIWNLVFMQFDRVIIPQVPGQDVIQLNPLPKPSIDTGMGLERIACVLQGVLSNYQTDLFTPLIARAAELTNFSLVPPRAGLPPTSGCPIHSGSIAMGGNVQGPDAGPCTCTNPGAPGLDSETWVSTAHLSREPLPKDHEGQSPELIPAWGAAPGSQTTALQRAEGPTRSDLTEVAISDAKGYASLRIIADHARAATFLISDGVLPANEGRGYVLRKILRRGIRHGRLLGQEQPFMHEMVLAVRDGMSVAYPELMETAERVAKVVLAEEEQFARVLAAGDLLLIRGLYSTAMREVINFQNANPGKNFAVEYLKARGVEVSDPSWNSQFVALERAISAIRAPLLPFTLEPLVVVTAALNELGHMAKYIGSDSFRLYETYGLPLDFMVDAARDAGIEFDLAGFEAAKEEEQQRARASWKGGSQKSASPAFRELPKTEFEGYTALRVDGARVLALVKDGVGVPALGPGEQGEAVLDMTSFYADSGGQVGDVGWLYSGDHHTVIADVSGATKPVQGVFAHRIVAKQAIAVGDVVDTVVDRENRLATERNHTGTHLLHAALRQVLGTHVKQAGSLNDPTRLRFDFSHFAQIAEPELREIESIVNGQVLGNTKVETLVDVPIDVAVNELGAMALFGEKYGDKVRVVKIGDFSVELCGGTHTGATGEIGLIKITGESSVSSGVRRVEAISGTGALGEFRRDFELSRVVGQLTGGGDVDALRHKISAQDEELKKLKRELDQLRMKAASASVTDAAGSAIEVKGVKVLAQRVDSLGVSADAKAQMRDLVDQLRGKLGSGVVVLGAAAEGRVSLIVGVTKDLTGRVQAGKIVGLLAAKVGGKGGGRPDLAEAGGSDVGGLDGALKSAAEVVGGLLG